MKTEIPEQDLSLKNKISNIKSSNDESEDEETMHFFGQNHDNTLPSTNSYNTVNDDVLFPSINSQKEKNSNNKKNKNNSDMDLMKMLLEDKFNEDSKLKEENQKDIFLNQIIVNDDEIKLNNFPIIEIINLKDYMISIPEKILDKGEFFTAITEEIEINKNNFIPNNFEIENINTFFNALSNKDNSYNDILKEIYDDLECENKNKILLRKIVKSIYDKCRCIICDIKRNIKNRKKKSKNEDLSTKLYVLMKIHNDIYYEYLSSNNINNMIIDNNENKNYSTYKKLFLEKTGGKTFECEICKQKFNNYQSLGGHTSKIHPDQSEKYKEKMTVRKNREDQRKLLDVVKKKLLEKYNINYDLTKNRDEKVKIKKFIREHYKEYNIIKRKIYKDAKLAFL